MCTGADKNSIASRNEPGPSLRRVSERGVFANVRGDTSWNTPSDAIARKTRYSASSFTRAVAASSDTAFGPWASKSAIFNLAVT